MSGSQGFVLPVDKPDGPTSHDVVDEARRALGVRRIGHAGTLDPFASGLLILCVGKATRLAEYLAGQDKSYVAEARLGVRTDTLDRDGAVVDETAEWTGLTEEAVRRALARFVGTIEQTPPQFSAKKVAGEPMHRRARRGERVELEPCRVTVRALELLRLDLPAVRFRVRCSSGTYVRSLASDVGDALGVGAHLTELRRTSIGHVSVDAALPAGRLGERAAVEEARLGMLEALRHLPTVRVDRDAAARLAHGQRLRLEQDAPSGVVAVETEGELLAVGEVGEGVLRPRKVLGG